MRRYLLDEHIPPIYRTQLLYHEPSLTVLIVGDKDTPARGTPDSSERAIPTELKRTA